MKLERTFFKLPLLLVLFYWLFNILYIVVYFTGFDDYFLLSNMTSNQLIKNLTKQVLINFYYQIPSSIVVFVFSVVLFNKYSINQVSSRNITNTFLVAILITSMDVAGRWFLYNNINLWIESEIYYHIADTYIYHTPFYELLCFIKIINIYIFVSIWTYFSIKLWNKNFIHDCDGSTQSESQRLHLGVFILLYNCYFNTLFFSFISFDGVHFSFIDIILNIIGLAIFLLITNLIGYFLLRKCFTGVTEVLNLKKLIFSSISIFIFNCILVAIIFWVSISLYEYLKVYYRLSKNFSLCYTWVIIGIVFILSSIMVKIMTKLLFGSKNNKINITQ